MQIYDVLLPLPFTQAFSYGYESSEPLIPGQFVTVPFRGRKMTGVIWPKNLTEDKVKSFKIKNITEVYPIPALSEEMQRFIKWVASYTMTPTGQVLKMCLSAPKAFNIPIVKYLELKDLPQDLQMTKNRQQIVSAFQNQQILAYSDLKQDQISEYSLKDLIDKNILHVIEKKSPVESSKQNLNIQPTQLRTDQEQAIENWKAYTNNHHVVLLDGMTGSGKTEVYFEMLAEKLQNNQQCLILLPEIALTAQWVKRFEKKFGFKPDIWHSDLSPTYRGKIWRHVAFGETRVLVGARSALFLPYDDLGIIIIDEEHDQSFKQEEQTIYHARDMAIARAKIEDIPILLASATPALETIANVENGKYKKITLTKRHGQAQLPQIHLLDLKEHPPEKKAGEPKWISPVLIKKMQETLHRGEQILLFLNRRGYAPLLICSDCGYRFHCPHCSAWLVEHRSKDLLMCHHCDYQIKQPETCPKCQSDEFASCGPGVERIAEEVQSYFPQYKSFLATSDHLNSPKKAQEFVKMVTDKQVDILIGTQILAKGYHFPDLTLVGILDADLGLDGGDLRAGEKTFQLLSQVSGRAGRAEKPGEVYIQTWNSVSPMMQYIQQQDRESFYQLELLQRTELSLPPFGRLTAFIFSSPDQDHAEKAAQQFKQLFQLPEKSRLFGPSPAPLFQLRGKYRFRLLLKTPKEVLPQKLIGPLLYKMQLPKDVKLQIDIDPQSFL